MGYSDDHIRQIQARRAKLFPPDRIAFMSLNWERAHTDVSIFKSYAKKEIPLQIAIAAMERNNYVSITEEQFLNEFRLLGYDRFRKGKDDES